MDLTTGRGSELNRTNGEHAGENRWMRKLDEMKRKKMQKGVAFSRLDEASDAGGDQSCRTRKRARGRDTHNMEWSVDNDQNIRRQGEGGKWSAPLRPGLDPFPFKLLPNRNMAKPELETCGRRPVNRALSDEDRPSPEGGKGAARRHLTPSDNSAHVLIARFAAVV